MTGKIDAKILYVEDEFFTRENIKNILLERYTTVFVAKDGLAGLNIYKENPDINIILTDIKMPNMDGIIMSREIREINKNIPIIIISAFDPDLFKFGDVEIQGFLIKPVPPFSLYSKIDKYVIT